VTTDDRIRYARWAGIALLVIAGALFYLHPSVTFKGFYSNDTVDTAVSDTCISPWNKWTEHYDTVSAKTLAAQADDSLVDIACNQAIAAREHYGWTAGGLGLLVLFGSFLPFGRRSELSSGTSVETFRDRQLPRSRNHQTHQVRD
jgi:hypothetical protein